MIIIRLSGGLGNQMFEYAVARSIAHDNNVELGLDIRPLQCGCAWAKILKKLDILLSFSSKIRIIERGRDKLRRSIQRRIGEIREYELHYFSINCNIIQSQDNIILLALEYILYKYYNEWRRPKYNIYFCKNGEFDHDLLMLSRNITDIYIDGLWGCQEYFQHNENIIKRELTLTKEVMHEYAVVNDNIEKQIKDTNSVCIHIRRGDYVENTYVNQQIGACSQEYYYNAITQISKMIDNPSYYVFSDDISWVQNNLHFPSKTYYITPNTRCIVDFQLMRECKHFIISNSTFSWWAAYLSEATKDKIVICPEPWFNDTKITLSLALNNWIKINK
ncbi:MAG: alpha-1,2-fucosyltransferase [Paludibacter sp.]|nr:alpha-1,2-fucosyltransferase [Paludibacter sp.]